ncbi:hypothetical protein DM01DRAFT_326892 [Hesseltinella vesiculosa]|uniref:Uncharacterized protein n=1 Tax=Hesseltinella vesiculosa TaxID=101127 RepID=A0A1X2G7D9_9FUNG|nr:hypothetical protein DM01DRAFT_326892 [Hesseltinella vesiculosa]
MLALLAACLVSLATSMPLKTRSYSIQLNSDSAFCSFLPPNYGDDVSGTEEKGIPQCTDKGLSNSGRVFPDGFIDSAHYYENNADHYVQVTGRMDRKAYGLKKSDQGGQYDYKHNKDVTCDGFKFFVNLVEPNANRYCIRCCKYARDCVIDKPTEGCDVVVPGDYSY